MTGSDSPYPGGALPVADRVTAWREARNLFSRHRWRIAGLVLLHLVAVGVGLVAPFLLGRLIDGVAEGGTLSAVDTMAALVAAAVIAHGLALWIAARSSYVLGELVFADLRESFVSRLLDLPPATVEEAGAGDVSSRTTRDVDTVSEFARVGFPDLLIGALGLTATLVAAFVVNPLVAVLCLVGLPVIAIATRWFARRAGGAFADELATAAGATSTVLESARGADVVDAFDLGEIRRTRTIEATRRARRAASVPLRLRAIWFPAAQVGSDLPLLAVVIGGAWLVTQSLATPGEVATIALYVQQLVAPLDDLVYWYGELQLCGAAYARIVGLAMVDPDRVPGDRTPADGRLVVSDLSHAYVPDRDAVRDISLDITAGERIAVVGASGAGKSTIGLLLAGVYVPSAGHVRLGGVDVTAIPLSRLRDEVCIVTQEEHVFTGTLADNLRLAGEHHGDASLWQALDLVGAAEWARDLTDGLETALGPGALLPEPVRVQQLALARIVLKNPSTVVLDEATSVFSDGRAGEVEHALDQALSGRTVVTIAHRLHTARDADRVVVMNDGRITEVGAHDELVRRDGPYRRLWDAWAADT